MQLYFDFHKILSWSNFFTDIDECEAGTDNCDANADCDNDDGGFACICNPGYSGDGQTCSGK